MQEACRACAHCDAAASCTTLSSKSPRGSFLEHCTYTQLHTDEMKSSFVGCATHVQSALTCFRHDINQSTSSNEYGALAVDCQMSIAAVVAAFRILTTATHLVRNGPTSTTFGEYPRYIEQYDAYSTSGGPNGQ